MIDGIKCTVHGVNPEALRRKLEFHTPVNDNTGEADPYSFSRLDNFRLSLNSQKGACAIRGSLHKFAHQGRNDTDFGYSALIESMDGLLGFFGVKPESVVLHNIEVGVNLDYAPAEIIDNLLLYGSNPFAPMSPNPRRFLGSRCELSQYALKVYGKNKTLLRLETQVKRMQFMNAITGGTTLTFDCLRDKMILGGLGKMLLHTWDKVMVWEEIALAELKDKEREVLLFGRYPSFWTDLQKANPENFKKKTTRFLDLQSQYKTTSRKEEVARLAGVKFANLLEA